MKKKHMLYTLKKKNLIICFLRELNKYKVMDFISSNN